MKELGNFKRSDCKNYRKLTKTLDIFRFISERQNMVTANDTNNLEHFVNYSVCFCEFDEETKEAKIPQIQFVESVWMDALHFLIAGLLL